MSSLMDKTREEFVLFVRQAVNDRKSLAYKELCQFMTACFVRADINKDGKVALGEFDKMVEEAAELPRRYGFAPTSEESYPSQGRRLTARARQFLEMDEDADGGISLHEWIEFCMNHIVKKVEKLPLDHLGGSSDDVSLKEFLQFVHKAVDKSTPEYKELYFFLLKTFQEGDTKKQGAVGPEAFDKMIEAAATAPRRFGLAPKSEDMFANEEERLAKRQEYFAAMDTNNDGLISFDEWLNYAYEHLVRKVESLN